MSNVTISLDPVFWQNTLPLMATILVAVGAAVTAGWISNANLGKRIDDTNAGLGKRIDDINTSLGSRIDDMNASLGSRIDGISASLGRIEDKLDGHGDRITRLEERTSPLRRS